jgi:hypothetical protein
VVILWYHCCNTVNEPVLGSDGLCIGLDWVGSGLDRIGLGSDRFCIGSDWLGSALYEIVLGSEGFHIGSDWVG